MAKLTWLDKGEVLDTVEVSGGCEAREQVTKYWYEGIDGEGSVYGQTAQLWDYAGLLEVYYTRPDDLACMALDPSYGTVEVLCERPN